MDLSPASATREAQAADGAGSAPPQSVVEPAVDKADMLADTSATIHLRDEGEFPGGDGSGEPVPCQT